MAKTVVAAEPAVTSSAEVSDPKTSTLSSRRFMLASSLTKFLTACRSSDGAWSSEHRGILIAHEREMARLGGWFQARDSHIAIAHSGVSGAGGVVAAGERPSRFTYVLRSLHRQLTVSGKSGHGSQRTEEGT